MHVIGFSGAAFPHAFYRDCKSQSCFLKGNADTSVSFARQGEQIVAWLGVVF